MLSTKIQTILVSSVAVAAVSVPATASAALRSPVGLKIAPVAVKTTAVALQAFPTGKGTVEEEELCDEWTHLLQGDQKEANDAVESNNLKQYVNATNALSADTNGALDDGCAVID
jgi:hypothetical protein